MLDIVTAQQHQLPLPVEIVDIDDPEAGLPGAGAVGAVHHEASARQFAENQSKQRDQTEDDRESDDVLGRP
jgi:hypothetical protein